MAARHPNSTEARYSDEDLRKIVTNLLDEWRWIAGFIALALVAAGLYLAAAPAVYRTNVLLQLVQDQADFSGLHELSDALSGSNFAQAELQIIESRAVLLPTVESLGLACTASPTRFPILGEIVANRYESVSDGLAEPWLRLDGYAWGGEKIRVDQLAVPLELEGTTLSLTALADGRYVLYGAGDEPILESIVGEVAEGGGVRMLVSELVARPGTRFGVRKDDLLARVDELRREITVHERGRKSGIIDLQIEGEDPEQIANILNQISSEYVSLSVDHKSADAAAMRGFLNEQLPEVKTDLNRAEAELNAYRIERGTIDLSLETKGLLTQLAEVEAGLTKIELERAALEQRFTPEHPSMLGLAEQQSRLEQLRHGLKQDMRALPKSEQDSFRLMRGLRVASELYTAILSRTQELKVIQAGTIGDVRVIDEAFVPRVPIDSPSAFIFTTAAFLGALLGIGFVVVRRSLDGTIHDPVVLEEISGLPVFASVPHSEYEKVTRTSARKGLTRDLLAVRSPRDPAIESLRSLRTNLDFLFETEGLRTLTICGSAPGVGKSFTSINLAALMASTDRRVVLIDGDLRRGILHRLVGQPRGPGLAELLAGNVDLTSAVYGTTINNLRLIPTGMLPSDPSELVSEERLSTLLSKLTSEYELVVFDSPPVLAASEAVLLARATGVSLMVVRSEQQTRREVEAALKRLRHGGVRLRGFIFNDVKVRWRNYYDYYSR